MKQNKKKYDELQAKVFLLTEENEQLKARLEEVEAVLARKLERVCGQ